MPMLATCDQSGGIKRPMEANSEMGIGVGDVDTGRANIDNRCI